MCRGVTSLMSLLFQSYAVNDKFMGSPVRGQPVYREATDNNQDFVFTDQAGYENVGNDYGDYYPGGEGYGFPPPQTYDGELAV